MGEWKRGLDNQWIFCVNDNSLMEGLEQKVNIDDIRTDSSDSSVNLAISRYNGSLYTSNYVGVCHLRDLNNEFMRASDGYEVILKVEPRFGMSVVDMLNSIKEDDEFERYLAPQTIRVNSEDREVEDLIDNELFRFFNDEPTIHIIDDIAKDSSSLTATIYISMMKQLCNRPLIGRMISKEENLTGKIKGRISFSKNLKHNTVKGRDDRIYCRYLTYSEDILENQILKTALNKASRFINECFRGIFSESNSYAEMIAYCKQSLRHVTDQKASLREFASVKTSGCYTYYRPVLNMAKMVLSEVTLESNGTSRSTSYIIPYSVSMEKLFEMYVRMHLKRIGIASYSDEQAELFLEKYDYKTQTLINAGVPNATYINGPLKPDIIIRNRVTNKTAVFDVKYKDYSNCRYIRNDRLQMLSYCLMYDCENIGNIFPAKADDVSAFYDMNPLNSLDNRQRNYHQLELRIEGASDGMLLSKSDNSRQVTLLSYIISLFGENDR